MRRMSRSSMRRMMRRHLTDALDGPLALPPPPAPAAGPADRGPDRPRADDRDVIDIDEVDQDRPLATVTALPAATPPAVLPDRPIRPEASRWDAERRPLVPPSLAHPVQSGRTVAGNLLHDIAFHLLRLHVYAARAIAWTPRGLLRMAVGLWALAVDRESAPLRAAAVDRQDIGGYLLLSKDRDRHIRRRAPLSVLALVVVLALASAVANPETRLVALALIVAIGGWFGRPADRPLVDSPLIATGATKRPTAEMIVRALQSAGLCKEDDPPDFVAPGVHVDGPGYAAVLDLPYGYTASQAVEKAERIAAGLRVDEVRLTVERVRGNAAHAGRVRLWIANEDPYAAKPVPSPLVKASSWNLWKPIPFGVDKRGRPVSLQLVWTSMLVGAMPRMGKTFAVRLVAAAAALDPHVRLMLWDGKPGKDYKAFERVAHRYGCGIRDSVVEGLVAALREAVADMDRRFEKLARLPDKDCPDGKVTPAICARRDLDMPLTLIVIDEVQRYLEHPTHGETIIALLTEIAKVAPAVGYMLVLATQKPDADTIPSSLRDQIGTRAAFRTATWQFGDTILGAGSAKAGQDPSKFLITHKGVCWLVAADDGPLADQGPQIVRTHLMDLGALTKVIDRARELREEVGTLSGVATGEARTEALPDRFLDDVLMAFDGGEDRVWSERLCERLTAAQPEQYDGWGPTDLAAALKRHGIGTGQVWGRADDGTGANRRGVRRQHVVDALADRIGGPADTLPDGPSDTPEGPRDGR